MTRRLRRGDRRAVYATVALIASVPLSAWLATSARADSGTDAYTAAHGQTVCRTLDAYPSFDGILGIADAIHRDGFTYEQSGAIEADSVILYCPQHLPLLKAFIAANTAPAPAPQPTGGSLGGRYAV